MSRSPTACRGGSSGLDGTGGIPPRLRGLPMARVMGIVVPVAGTRRARALGLAMLDASRAGPGLLMPRCSSVHTFGMRFELDLIFLDDRMRPLALARAVPPRRVLAFAGARAVLEVPSARPVEGCAR